MDKAISRYVKRYTIYRKIVLLSVVRELRSVATILIKYRYIRWDLWETQITALVVQKQ